MRRYFILALMAAINALCAIGLIFAQAPKLDTERMWRGCELQREAITDLLQQTQQENVRLRSELDELRKAKASN